jgi:hypothetical protein
MRNQPAAEWFGVRDDELVELGSRYGDRIRGVTDGFGQPAG